MRITGNRLIDLAAASTSKSQSAVATASAQASSGMRVTTPSDDPGAWIAAQRTKLRQALSQGTGAAVTTGRERLGATDDALAEVVKLVRELGEHGDLPERPAGIGRGKR